MYSVSLFVSDLFELQILTNPDILYLRLHTDRFELPILELFSQIELKILENPNAHLATSALGTRTLIDLMLRHL